MTPGKRAGEHGESRSPPTKKDRGVGEPHIGVFGTGDAISTGNAGAAGSVAGGATVVAVAAGSSSGGAGVQGEEGSDLEEGEARDKEASIPATASPSPKKSPSKPPADST